MYLYRGKKIHNSVVIGEVSYPINWLEQVSADTLAKLGVVQVPDPEIPDLTKFDCVELEDGSLVITAKPEVAVP